MSESGTHVRARSGSSAGEPSRDQGDPYLRLSKARLGKTVRRKWRLDALLGVGGMAAVYAATHRNGSRVAIKMLHPLVATEEAKRRFLREGYLANSVGHPGVVRVLDDDEAEDGSIFLVMELLDGESLESFATRRVQLGAPETLAVAEQVLEVLAVAHAKGIVHRDVKPENVFLCIDGRVKLLDFGIARLLEVSRGSAAATHHGFLLGTPAYMAPEQARGDWELVDARTDVWAVGASMFRVLTGHTVHRGSTHLDLLMKATREPAPKVRDIAPAVPELVASLVDRALAFRKEERWASADEMLESLREVHRAMRYTEAPKLRARIAATSTVRIELPAPPAASAEFDRASALESDPLGDADDDAPTQIEAMTLTHREQLRSIVIEVPIEHDAATPVLPSIFDETGETAARGTPFVRTPPATKTPAPRPAPPTTRMRAPLTRSVIAWWIVAALAVLVFALTLATR
ncbi:serine/threonine-protein kinase [Sandaracinus amylolyticus]|uniref:serine/threonine-protein kinase n=1 Tax=Sandaracinus amylolyticus TaxID=927083 RepID=UPI001F1AAEA6|nr:serine/threonine-protein kinase [Sandaracinus amylolyticus]